MVRERVASIGGKCEVLSTVGAGTHIRVVVPDGQSGSLEDDERRTITRDE
jgi:signal transduction histidine kinase